MQLVISLILFAAAIAYVEWRLKSVNRANDEADKQAEEHFATKKALKDHIEAAEKQRQLDNQDIDDRLSSIEQRVFFQPAAKQPEETAIPHEEAPKDVFYFRWPADDGSFDDGARELSPSENTYYQFHLLSPTEAEFTFFTVSDTQLSKANNSSKKYIERACTFVNAKSAKYTCTPGKAHLERGKWLVDLKARIEYK